MPTKEGNLANDSLEPLIFTIRDRRVILDADLARLYGVPTYRFNEAFKRNRRRFPNDFAFQLTEGEFADLRLQEANSSQFAMSSSQDPDDKGNVMNRSQFSTSASRRRGTAYRPWAFTEHGALMAANVLHSERAVQMSVFVVRAFVRLREHIAANAAILKRLAEIDKALLEHDQALGVIWNKLQPLLQPQPEPPKPRIRFRTPA